MTLRYAFRTANVLYANARGRGIAYGLKCTSIGHTQRRGGGSPLTPHISGPLGVVSVGYRPRPWFSTTHMVCYCVSIRRPWLCLVCVLLGRAQVCRCSCGACWSSAPLGQPHVLGPGCSVCGYPPLTSAVGGLYVFRPRCGPVHLTFVQPLVSGRHPLSTCRACLHGPACAVTTSLVSYVLACSHQHKLTYACRCGREGTGPFPPAVPFRLGCVPRHQVLQNGVGTACCDIDHCLSVFKSQPALPSFA